MATASAGALAFTLCAGLVRPQVADACGGTFCDGPQGMAVDQSGENILFVLDGDTVEAHIQIQYDPMQDPASFAWVIPLTALPEFSVGSQPLFDRLLAGSVPFYGLNDTNEFCGEDESSGLSGSGDDGDGPKFDAGAGETGGGPEVVHQETVGAFEVTVLQDDNVDSLMQWLGDNGYQQDEAAAPIFQEYLDEGHLFAAFKLNTGAGIDQIHPVTLTFQGLEPCIPLRLTKIAASEDMDVRAFFLGTARTVPTNYRHVLVNPLKIDWFNFGGNYKDVITQAVDAFKADGRAFVTEYAGPSGVVQSFGLHNAAWDSSAFVGAAPTDVISLLDSQGIVACYGDFCDYFHPLLEPLLAEFLPAPDGVEPGDFYSCLDCFEPMIDLDAWGDGSGFAAAYSERVIEPAAHAVSLLETWPYLTRLYTTISPGEMTEDPMFAANASLPDVPNTRIATRITLCTNHRLVVLPDGREVFVPEGEGWPEFPDEMPWDSNVQQMPPVGAPMTLVDNDVVINQFLEEWNSAHGWPPDDGSTPTTTGTTGDGGTGSTGGNGSGTGTSGSGGGTDSGPSADGDASGCGCASDRGAGGPLAFAFALMVLGIGRARRTRRV